MPGVSEAFFDLERPSLPNEMAERRRMKSKGSKNKERAWGWDISTSDGVRLDIVSLASGARFRTVLTGLEKGGGGRRFARSHGHLIFPVVNLGRRSYHALVHSDSRIFHWLCRHSCVLFQVRSTGQVPEK
jgi:hypothetical protein